VLKSDGTVLEWWLRGAAWREWLCESELWGGVSLNVLGFGMLWCVGGMLSFHVWSIVKMSRS